MAVSRLEVAEAVEHGLTMGPLPLLLGLLAVARGDLYNGRYTRDEFCLGSLETDLEWLEFNDRTNTFHTNRNIGGISAGREELKGVLSMICTGNNVRSIPFTVHITRMNRHAPSFTKASYSFFVPLSTEIGWKIGQLEVTDQDSVIYNSGHSLSWKSPSPPLLGLLDDGSVVLKESLDFSRAYRPITATAVAVDYGSPQLFAEVNVTVLPVTVSPVRNLRVNVATGEYQVVEWEEPAHGDAAKYTLKIHRGEHLLLEEEVPATERKALTRVRVGPGQVVTLSVGAVGSEGVTPSEAVSLSALHGGLSCPGECGVGGVPICIFSHLNIPQQFVDGRGGHCRCFRGFSGHDCRVAESCAAEKVVEAYGGMDWPETAVNASVKMLCPYHETAELWRRCEWDEEGGSAVWSAVNHHERCPSQASVLQSLNIFHNHIMSADKVSALKSASHMIGKNLAMATFAEAGSAHFDQKIAQKLATILNTVIGLNLSTIEGNSTEVDTVKRRLLAHLDTLNRRLPVPFNLESEQRGISLHTLLWLPGQENFRTMMGSSCYIQLPAVDDRQVVRGTCMSNSTLFESSDPLVPSPKNSVLVLTVDNSASARFSKITFGLRALNTSENYTCVYYDELEGGWSTRGLRTSSPPSGDFVVCESSHLSVFSLLPSHLFVTHPSILRDLAVLLPTVTSFIAIVCSIFLLFLAAIQSSASIDFALLLFLFLVFLIHCLHLVQLLSPMIGDLFYVYRGLPLAFQFCLIGVCSLSTVMASAIHSSTHRRSQKAPRPPCSPFCSTFFFGIIVPSSLTAAEYFLSKYNHGNGGEGGMSSERWHFLLDFLAPCALFVSITTGLCLHSIGSVSSQSSDTLSSTTQCASSLLLLVGTLVGHVSLFAFRHQSELAVPLVFSLVQISYCMSSFLFAGFLFRLGYMEVNGEEGSTRSLERKRDISRALLEHVHGRSESAVVREGEWGGASPPSLSLGLFDRPPMVSVV